jgi:hypothetical protein
VREVLAPRQPTLEHSFTQQKRGNFDELARIRKYFDDLVAKSSPSSRASNRNHDVTREYFSKPISLSDYLTDAINRYENRLDPSIENLINSSIETLINKPTKQSYSSGIEVEDMFRFLMK